MKLTKAERLLLINQFEIRRAFSRNDDAYHEEIRILTEGHELHYDTLVSRLDEDIPEAKSQFVLSVLDMFDDIERYKRDNPGDSEIEKHPRSYFSGFDYNHEGEYATVVDFLIKTRELFAEQLADKRRPDGFNSHAPRVQVYTDMLRAWKSLGEKMYSLTHETALSVLNAGINYP